MKKFLILLLAGCCSMILTSCTTRLTDFTIISTKNIDLSEAANFQRGNSRVEGIDKKYMIIIIPTGQPNMKEAIDRAIESVPGAIALVDGVLSITSWYIPCLYGETYYAVEGTALIDPSLLSSNASTDYIISRLDTAGQVEESKFVTNEEYKELKEKIIKDNFETSN